MENRIKKIEIENAQFAYNPNFSGRKSDNNPQGFRGFTVIIDENIAEKLIEDGWNIKYKKLPYKQWVEGDPLTPTLDVSVRLDEDTPFPAKVYLIENGKKHQLFEGDVGMLDETNFENIDIIIRPRLWKVNGKTGIKAYLDTLYASGITDTITSKYLDIPFADE